MGQIGADGLVPAVFGEDRSDLCVLKFFNVEGKQYLYRVKTYKDERAWDSTVHILLTNANSSTIPIGKKIFITMDKSSMNRVIVRFANLPEIVTLLYPLPQSDARNFLD